MGVCLLICELLEPVSCAQTGALMGGTRAQNQFLGALSVIVGREGLERSVHPRVPRASRNEIRWDEIMTVLQQRHGWQIGSARRPGDRFVDDARAPSRPAGVIG